MPHFLLHRLSSAFWSVLYFALFGPQASKFAKSDGAGVPGPGQLEAKIFTFFSREKNAFFSRKYTPHTQILTFGPISKKRNFFDFGRFFLLLFSDFLASRPRKSLSPAAGSGPGPGQLKAKIFKILLFAEKTLFSVQTTHRTPKF